MTILLYISVCLRTRQDSISYSSIYIIQKAEFQGKNRGNRGLETGEQGTGIRDWNQGKEIRGKEQRTGVRGKQGTGIRGKEQGLETGETEEQGTGNRRLESGGKQGTGIRGKRTGDWNQGKEIRGTGDWMY